MGSMCVPSCRCCVLVSVVHPFAILSAVFCDICSLLIFVSDASGDHIVETYSSMGLVDINVLSCVLLFVVIYMCLLYVSLESRFSHSIFGLMFMGSVMLSICSSSCVLYSAGSGVKRVYVVLSALRMRLFV